MSLHRKGQLLGHVVQPCSSAGTMIHVSPTDVAPVNRMHAQPGLRHPSSLVESHNFRLQEENIYNSRIQSISGYPMTSSITCGGYSPPLVTSKAEPTYLSGNYVIKSDMDSYKEESRHAYAASGDYLQYRPAYPDSVTYRVVPKREIMEDVRGMNEIRPSPSLNDARVAHAEVRTGLGDVRATLGDMRGGLGEVRNSFGTIREANGYIPNSYGAVSHDVSVHNRTHTHNSPIAWETTTPDYHLHQQQYAYPGYAQSGPASISHYPPASLSNQGMLDKPSLQPSLQELEAERVIRRARRNRTCFTRQQLERLEESFLEQRYPDIYRREEISSQLELKEEVVRVWFKNRRAKCKRQAKDTKPRPAYTSADVKTSSSPAASTHNNIMVVTPGESNTNQIPTYPSTFYSSDHHSMSHDIASSDCTNGLPENITCENTIPTLHHVTDNSKRATSCGLDIKSLIGTAHAHSPISAVSDDANNINLSRSSFVSTELSSECLSDADIC